MTEDRRVLSRTAEEGDSALATLRPTSWDDFIGQEEVKRNLRVFIDAARNRGEPLDHVLLCGPPGLGKTTLARLIARESGVGFRQTSGPVLLKRGDLAALLTGLEAGDVLFIDEIHRLSSSIEEILYPAMEDKQLDIVIGSGVSARSLRVDLVPFTLVGATTRSGLLTRPLRERFGIPLHLQFYDTAALATIIASYAVRLGVSIDSGGASEIATRARMTPRVALRLLRRVRDFLRSDSQTIDKTLANKALSAMGVDEHGMDGMDRRYLDCLLNHYHGGPVGVEALAASLSEQRDVVEDTIEAFLLQLGLLQRTPRGRMLTAQGWQFFNRTPPTHWTGQMPLSFDEETKKDES
ncbi:MAG: Holliday junction branch migration DNA helicase RuvB [Alphaproteobacteria bacterium GM202ARS2]|nr:Holliday junction branch migration DNA helicase RuvB [Alphaproteobacteria bacterium GM202ARS2]